jgi:hypothetical protein
MDTNASARPSRDQDPFNDGSWSEDAPTVPLTQHSTEELRRNLRRSAPTQPHRVVADGSGSRLKAFWRALNSKPGLLVADLILLLAAFVGFFALGNFGLNWIRYHDLVAADRQSGLMEETVCILAGFEVTSPDCTWLKQRLERPEHAGRQDPYSLYFAIGAEEKAKNFAGIELRIPPEVVISDGFQEWDHLSAIDGKSPRLTRFYISLDPSLRPTADHTDKKVP